MQTRFCLPPVRADNREIALEVSLKSEPEQISLRKYIIKIAASFLLWFTALLSQRKRLLYGIIYQNGMQVAVTIALKNICTFCWVFAPGRPCFCFIITRLYEIRSLLQSLNHSLEIRRSLPLTYCHKHWWRNTQPYLLYCSLYCIVSCLGQVYNHTFLF